MQQAFSIDRYHKVVSCGWCREYIVVPNHVFNTRMRAGGKAFSVTNNVKASTNPIIAIVFGNKSKSFLDNAGNGKDSANGKDTEHSAILIILKRPTDFLINLRSDQFLQEETT